MEPVSSLFVESTMEPVSSLLVESTMEPVSSLLVELFMALLELYRIRQYDMDPSAKTFIPAIVAASILGASLLATLLYILRDMASTQRRLSSTRSPQNSWPLDNTVSVDQNEAVPRPDDSVLLRPRPHTAPEASSRRTSRGSRSSRTSLNLLNPFSDSGGRPRPQSSSNDEVFYDAEATLPRSKKSHKRSYSFAKAFAKVKDSFRKVDDEFECPICFEQMKAPKKIFQCAQGHVICGDCQKRVVSNLCPTCRGPLTGRNVAMEKLSESYFGSMAFECPLPPEPDTPPESERNNILTTEL